MKPRHYRDYHDEYYATGVPVVHHYDSAAVVRAAPAVQVAPRRRNHYAAKKAGKDFKNKGFFLFGESFSCTVVHHPRPRYHRQVKSAAAAYHPHQGRRPAYFARLQEGEEGEEHPDSQVHTIFSQIELFEKKYILFLNRSRRFLAEVARTRSSSASPVEKTLKRNSFFCQSSYVHFFHK